MSRSSVVPLLGVAPELRDVDRHAVQEAVELVLVGLEPGGVRGQVRRCRASAAKERMRRSIWPRLYCERSMPQARRTASQSTSVVGVGGRDRVAAPTAVSADLAAIASASSPEADDLVGQLGLDDRARHAVDGAGRLGLGQDAAAAGAHLVRAVEAVLAHAGHDDEQEALAEELRRRRRSSGLRAGAARRSRPRRSGARRRRRRGAGGCRRGRAGACRAAAASPPPRLLDRQLGAAVQALGQRRGEARRHVLDDEAAGAQRGRAARGSRSASARGPPVEVAIERPRAAVRGGARRAVRPRGGVGPRRAWAAGPRPSPATAAASTLSRSAETNGLQRLAERGLGDEVEGALGEGVDRAGAVGGRERRHHDDRQGWSGPRSLAQGAQDADPVEAGHRQVEGHGVGAQASR